MLTKQAMTVRFYDDDDAEQQQYSVSFKYSIVKIECNCRQAPRVDDNLCTLKYKSNENTLDSNDANKKLCEAEIDMKNEPESKDPPTYWLYSTYKQCLIVLNKLAQFLNQVNVD